MRIWPPHSTLSRNGEDIEGHRLRPRWSGTEEEMTTPGTNSFPLQVACSITNPTPFPERRIGEDMAMHITTIKKPSTKW